MRNEEPGEGGSRGERRRAGGRSSRAGPRVGNGDTDATRCRADSRTGARGAYPPVDAGRYRQWGGVGGASGCRVRLLGEDGGWRG